MHAPHNLANSMYCRLRAGRRLEQKVILIAYGCPHRSEDVRRSRKGINFKTRDPRCPHRSECVR